MLVGQERDKRLRKDSTEQFIEPTGVFKDYDKDPYTKPFERAPIKEDADVGIIGAGYGGMMAGVYLQRLGVTSYKMIDKGGSPLSKARDYLSLWTRELMHLIVRSGRHWRDL